MHESEGKCKVPLVIITLCGGTALAMMAYRLGVSVFAEWFFYPSIFFFSFAAFRLLSRGSQQFDRKIWKACQWWSGFWLLWFLLGFCAIPFSIALWIPLAAISTDGSVNPFLALILHLVICSCASDLLKSCAAPSATSSLPTDH